MSMEPGAPWPAERTLPQRLLPPVTMGQVGKYRLLGLLGQGGMAVVFRAEDPLLQRSLALKLLLRPPASRDDAFPRFLREARAAARLNHPHVVTVYEAGEWEQGAYL